MTRQAAISRQRAADLPPSLIEEILLEWVLSGETLPRSPRRRPSRSLLEQPRLPSIVDDELELAMPLRLAA
jgi:hypothetical protein